MILRHTFNTNARKEGVLESVIMKIAGRHSRDMFERYNTIDKSDLEKAEQRVGVLIGKCD